MPLVDLIILIIIGIFACLGFWFGFITTLGSFIGFFGGIFLASRFYNIFGGSIWFKILLFILIYIIVGRLIGLIFYILNKILKLIPFTSLINRFVGALFGILEGFLVVLGAVFILHFYKFDIIFKFFQKSHLIPWFLKFSKLLSPFVTKALSLVNII